MNRWAFLVAYSLAATAGADAPRPLRIDDVDALQDVRDVQLSPDGRTLAYVVERVDRARDTTASDLWMVPVAGGEPLRLTSSDASESSPRFSPDGRFLAFLAKRDGDKKKQVYRLDLRGGEAVRLTEYKSDVSDLAWSPDSRRLALVLSDPDPADPDFLEGCGDDDEKLACTAPPIVIRRLQFKRDEEGYLRDLRSHLHVLDVATKASTQITSGDFDDADPAWSPDGRRLAFVSKRTLPDPDRSQDEDIFVVDAVAGATARPLAPSPGRDASPRWSPDGRAVTFVMGGDPKDMWYGTTRVAVAPAEGSAATDLTPTLDRNVIAPRFSPDGKHVYFLTEDGGNRHLARVPAAGGAVERVVSGERHVAEFVLAPGVVAVLEGTPQQPFEVSIVERSGLRRLTHVNDAFLSGLRLGKVERFRTKSRDGTPIDGFLVRPPDATPGTRLPTVLRIHGGPTDQYSTEFMVDWQMLAAHGFAVVAANPRGSSGYGRDFSRAIWADWGNKDYDDVMAAVDHVVAEGTADPDRLGVGGWSYGGMLTNYVITKTTRFKAAVTGASETNYLANYGADHYQYEWETELGLPWENAETWIRLSPFFQVTKVRTPTLIVSGQADLNIPVQNSEQLYQALRRLGVPTEFVIYPGESHTIDRPSYVRDRLQRYLDWYGRYLKAAGGS
jgi:dipeptidyl aminopeptidase/acylaminoacyl peptidase